MERVTAELLLGSLFEKQHYQSVNSQDDFPLVWFRAFLGGHCQCLSSQRTSPALPAWRNRACPEKNPSGDHFMGHRIFNQLIGQKITFLSPESHPNTSGAKRSVSR